MKLSAVYFDDTVVIPGGKDTGSAQPRQDLRESSFHASEGWTLERVERGVYRIWSEGMPKPAHVEGYGSTYVEADRAPGSVVVTSIDGDGVGTITLDDPSGVSTFRTPRGKR